MSLKDRSYDITVGSGILKDAGTLLNLKRKVFILTDSGVPTQYSEEILRQSSDGVIYTVPEGEGSKSIATLEGVLSSMLNFGLCRSDVLVAVGGGVVGDLGGFAAAVYMRGIDFYNVPTTVLSAVDSSIGGKTAVNLGLVKNTVGAFHQPRAVIIDTDTLKTLPKRQIANGLAEAVKMAVTSDEVLFSRLESEGFTEDNAEEIISAALKIKKNVVEEDECEAGLRKILNFGHTLGHGIEAEEELSGLYHGECVALGILPVLAKSEQKRVASLLCTLGLPMDYKYDKEKALSYISHDKKCSGGKLTVILSDKIGTCRMEKMTVDEFKALVLDGKKEI